jgi:hypothetical protein
MFDQLRAGPGVAVEDVDAVRRDIAEALAGGPPVSPMVGGLHGDRAAGDGGRSGRPRARDVARARPSAARADVPPTLDLASLIGSAPAASAGPSVLPEPEVGASGTPTAADEAERPHPARLTAHARRAGLLRRGPMDVTHSATPRTIEHAIRAPARMPGRLSPRPGDGTRPPNHETREGQPLPVLHGYVARPTPREYRGSR